MTKTVCPPGAWTTIPDTGGAMKIQVNANAVTVDTANNADPTQSTIMGSGDERIISEGVPVRCRPVGSIAVTVFSQIY